MSVQYVRRQQSRRIIEAEGAAILAEKYADEAIDVL
jgi:hypothetical protein